MVIEPEAFGQEEPAHLGSERYSRISFLVLLLSLDEECSSRQLPHANGGCYGAAGCCRGQMETLLRRRRLLSQAKSGCGRVSDKIRQGVSRDVEVAACSQTPFATKRRLRL
ncbi:hypothetical protein YC2023_090220 [Brassica napus]